MPHTREAAWTAMPAMPGTEAAGIPGESPRTGDANKDWPLRDDTQLLGRVLGDPVREQQGAPVRASRGGSGGSRGLVLPTSPVDSSRRQ